jgi:hypothetical protein
MFTPSSPQGDVTADLDRAEEAVSAFEQQGEEETVSEPRPKTCVVMVMIMLMTVMRVMMVILLTMLMMAVGC